MNSMPSGYAPCGAVTGHQQEYPSLTAACEAVARQSASVKPSARPIATPGAHRLRPVAYAYSLLDSGDR